MTQKIAITGANRGIGLAFAKAYQSRGATVFALCRESSPELDKLGVTVVPGIDVGDSNVQQILGEALHNVSLDILINNAGILRSEKLGSLDYATMAEQFMINAVGPLRITETLLPNLTTGSKVALITSRMGSIADNTSGGAYGYRMSKAALNAAGVSLARDLEPRGIAVAILHPGYVQTDMVNHGGDISADEAAERMVERIEYLNLKNSGTFWHSNGQVLPW